MSTCTTCNSTTCTCSTDGSFCPVGTVGVYDENGSFAGCLSPQDAKAYNDDKGQCATGFVKLVDPHTGEFLGCVLAADLAGLLTALEAATLHVGLSTINVSCDGFFDGSATVNISGGTAPYVTTWTDDVFTPVVPNALGVGTYILTVTDAANVSQVKYFNITEPQPISGTFAVQNESAPAAGDGRAIVYPKGGTPAYTFVWKDSLNFPIGQTTQEATNLVPDTYSCDITDFNGCTHTIFNIIVA